MSAVSFICFMIVAAIVLSCFRRGADPLSPGRVFGLTWALAIGLADLKFSLYQQSWTPYAWTMLLLGIISLLIGLFIPYVLSLHGAILSVPEVRTRLRRQVADTVDLDRLLWLLAILFVAYLIAYAVEAAAMGNVPLFSRNPERARVSFGLFGVHLFVTAMLSILLFAVEYLLFAHRDRVKRVLVYAVFIITAGTFFLLLQRYTFFIWGVMALGIAYYSKRGLRWRSVLLSAAVFIGVLVLIQSLRSAQYAERFLYTLSKMKYGPQYALFTEPYMYIVMNLENFARAAEHLDRFYFGYFSFDWLMALVGLKHWLGDYFGIVQLPYLISSYNTFTFHWWYYYDFGPVGVAVEPFLIGLGIGISYYKLRSCPTITTAYLYAIALLFMINSFIMNPLMRLDFVSNLAVIFLAHRYLLRKRPVLAERQA